MAQRETVNSRLQSAPLVVVAEAGAMRAHAPVSMERLTGLAVGTPVTVRVGQQSYASEVSYLEPVQSDAAIESRYRLDVSFPTGRDPLRPGLMRP